MRRPPDVEQATVLVPRLFLLSLSMFVYRVLFGTADRMLWVIMTLQQEKKLYQPPRVVAVEFNVEEGFASILLGWEIPFYTSSANSGDGFWSGSSGGGASSGNYFDHGFSWDGSSNNETSGGGYSGFGWDW